MYHLTHAGDGEAATRVTLAFQHSLQSWGGLLEWLPVGIYTCDRAGTLVQYNRRAAELWGQSPTPGEPHYRYCGAYRAYGSDGTPLTLSQAPMRELLRTGEPIRNRELVIERPDGSRLTVLANLDPLLGPDGGIVGGVNCFQDITDRKQAEALLREREQHFGELLEALPAAIYTTDAEGRITFYNRAAAELWGHRPELGSDRWCGSWRLYRPDGTPLPHDQCPMAVTLRENRPVRNVEAIVERPDGTRIPFLPYPTPLQDAAGALVGAVNMLVDISHHKQAEETQKLLVGELNHRVKNTLAIVQAIAHQTLRWTRSPADFVPRFNGRVAALAHAHMLLTQSVWRGADLMALLREQLVLGPGEAGRVACAGPEVLLAPQAALHLAMVFHELATNARKHGALSVPEGRLSVRWTVEDQEFPALRLRWAESGRPRVGDPVPPGFGTVLIEQSLKPHGGAARMACGADGVSWEIDLPLPPSAPAQASRPDKGDAAAASTAPRPGDGAGERGDLAGRRILVVEDEPLLALDIASSLAEVGVAVLGPAATVEQALRLIEIAPFDGALLDANLDGHPVDEVAAALTRRNSPVAFVTGYGPESLPLAFRAAPIVAKPFSPAGLIQAVRQFATRRDAAVLPLRGRAGPG